MAMSRNSIWQEMIQLSPLCSGSLHEQYLPCGKPGCRCHDSKSPQLHGPYYLSSGIGGRHSKLNGKGIHFFRIPDGPADFINRVTRQSQCGVRDHPDLQAVTMNGCRLRDSRFSLRMKE